MSVPSLNDLKRLPQWVTWVRDENDRKVLKNPATGGNAKYNKSETWGNREAAEQRWRRMKNGKDDSNGGIGLVIGKSYWGMRIVGIDIDGCVHEGVITDAVVKEVVERCNTYTEISPSGVGLKLFFQAEETAYDLIGGKAWKSFNRGEHQEMALVFRRYFTVTGNQFGTCSTLRFVSLDDIKWLINDAGPRYLKAHKSDDDDGPERDDSRSGDARRFFQERRDDYGEGYEAARSAILVDPARSGEGQGSG
jgi:primase-polymerase (primpol)-like protein